jgi:hypothetical protein
MAKLNWIFSLTGGLQTLCYVQNTLLKYADVGGGVFFLNVGAHLPEYRV